MVSYEHGKFILRRGDDSRKLEHRSRRCKRILLVALSCSVFYSYTVFLKSQPAPDASLLEAARAAGVGPSSRNNSIDAVGETPPGSLGYEQSTDVSLYSAGVDDDVENEPSLDKSRGSAGDADNDVQSSARSPDTEQSPDISLNKKYLTYLQTLDPIPKKVHMFFPDKDYWRKEPIDPFVEHSILSLKKLNPDWNVTVYDDEMVDDVIRRAAAAHIIPREECDILVGKKDDEGNVMQEPAHIVERSDIARLLLMYSEGGFYIDVDRLISKKIDDVIQPNTRLCLPTHDDVNFCQDEMCTARGNELFLSMIREASKIRMPLKRRRGWTKGGALFDLGPVLYNKHVFIHVFGGDKDMHSKFDDGVSVPRELIANQSGGVIVTKKETDCDDGLLVDDSLPRCYDRGSLYDMYDMEPWAPQVDARWDDNDEKKM